MSTEINTSLTEKIYTVTATTMDNIFDRNSENTTSDIFCWSYPEGLALSELKPELEEAVKDADGFDFGWLTDFTACATFINFDCYGDEFEEVTYFLIGEVTK